MAVTWKDDTGHALITTYATILTFSANAIAGGAKVLGATIVNVSTSDHVIHVALVPSGQSVIDQYLIFQDTVPASSTITIPGGPWPASASAFVSAKADGVGAGDVFMRVHAFEET